MGRVLSWSSASVGWLEGALGLQGRAAEAAEPGQVPVCRSELQVLPGVAGWLQLVCVTSGAGRGRGVGVGWNKALSVLGLGQGNPWAAF